MNVTLPADGGRISEHLRDRGDRVFDVFLRLRLVFERLLRLEGHRGHDRACPGAEILRGKRFSRDLVQVFVDIIGRDIVPFPILVEILEDFLSGEILQSLDNPGDAAVLSVDVMFPGFLRKQNRTAFFTSTCRFASSSGQRLVFLHVFFAPDLAKVFSSSWITVARICAEDRAASGRD